MPFTYAQLSSNGIAIGDVSPDGILYASSGGGGQRPWMAVDVDQDSPTFLQVLDGGTVPAPANPTNAGLDWVYNPDDGRLYSFGINANNDNVFLYAFDPANASAGYVQVGSFGALIAPNGVPAVGNQANSSPRPDLGRLRRRPGLVRHVAVRRRRAARPGRLRRRHQHGAADAGRREHRRRRG